MKKLFAAFLLLTAINTIAQKKPLDHTVYDNWKSIGERMISNDGQYVVYTVNPQEGDGDLVIQNPLNNYKKVVPRGYQAIITQDSKYAIFRIKPLFADIRLAKIKKKKAEEMPFDTLAIIELGKDSIFKKPRIKSYKVPEKEAGFIVYQLAKSPTDSTKKKNSGDSVISKNDLLIKLADSLIKKSIDSVKGNITKEELTAIINKTTSQILKAGKDMEDADDDGSSDTGKSTGGDLYLKSLVDFHEIFFKNVGEYFIDKKGNSLLMEIPKNKKDSTSIPLVILYHLHTQKTDTLTRGFNDAKNYVFDEAGQQLAFVAERDSSEKALSKFYKLWYYTGGQDSAVLIADKNTVGMQLGFTVSEVANISFSKDGNKLFFGNTPIKAPKDTTLVDFETAKLDIWNYKDDYLQPQQLRNLSVDLNRSYTAVYQIPDKRLLQLGGEGAELITKVNEGNADWVLGETNMGNRIPAQWTGRTRNSAFVINTITGEKKTVFTNLFANAEASPSGRFVFWYNPEAKNYFTYEVATGITRNVTDKITVALADEENDEPDFANEYGTMGWQSGDSALYVYDRYDVWKTAPDNSFKPTILNTNQNQTGRTKNETSRVIKTDPEERFFSPGKKYLFSTFNRINKAAGLYFRTIDNNSIEKIDLDGKAVYTRFIASKSNNALSFSKENYQNSPNIYYMPLIDSKSDEKINDIIRLSNINPQQKDYNWGTAELFKWKTYNGKETEGILYKPENFDPKKKYPLICYFYEKLTDGLYNYIAPAPTPSRLNISFFVSRGYIVLAPDISYIIGHPGNSAYDYIVSGARALVKKGLIDSTKIGIQGQSWGGYQVAHLITRTKLFKAAWAGAPVANMTSAYGGIRWASGLNRQFQYEKTQSRIGATLWEKPQLYIENSPLFHLPKVQTPLVIMANDADGAVPWYQGIELFTALKRLGKPVWMLNYNGEEHNLVERRNRKDIQIREQQFFDWQLKGEVPAKWLIEGVPAIDKGKDWGLKPE